MRFRFYCRIHDSLWAYDKHCETAILADATHTTVEGACKFERVGLVNERSWRLRSDFRVLPIESGHP